MDTRLEVGNLRASVKPEALREHFEVAGPVVDVWIVHGGRAFVTMGTADAAREAILTLNGSSFDERTLRVEAAREPRPSERPGRPSLRITRETRERCFVGYELDHHGTALAIRMFPTDAGDGEPTWRIEVAPGGRGDAMVSAHATTRTAALDEVGRTWRRQAAILSLPTLDWEAIASLLRSVRAT